MIHTQKHCSFSYIRLQPCQISLFLVLREILWLIWMIHTYSTLFYITTLGWFWAEDRYNSSYIFTSQKPYKNKKRFSSHIKNTQITETDPMTHSAKVFAHQIGKLWYIYQWCIDVIIYFIQWQGHSRLTHSNETLIQMTLSPHKSRKNQTQTISEFMCFILYSG